MMARYYRTVEVGETTHVIPGHDKMTHAPLRSCNCFPTERVENAVIHNMMEDNNV